MYADSNAYCVHLTLETCLLTKCAVPFAADPTAIHRMSTKFVWQAADGSSTQYMVFQAHVHVKRSWGSEFSAHVHHVLTRPGCHQEAAAEAAQSRGTYFTVETHSTLEWRYNIARRPFQLAGGV